MGFLKFSHVLYSDLAFPRFANLLLLYPKYSTAKKRIVWQPSNIPPSYYFHPVKVMTTGIAGGLNSPKRALLLAPLKGLLGVSVILNKIWGYP